MGIRPLDRGVARALVGCLEGQLGASQAAARLLGVVDDSLSREGGSAMELWKQMGYQRMTNRQVRVRVRVCTAGSCERLCLCDLCHPGFCKSISGLAAPHGSASMHRRNTARGAAWQGCARGAWRAGQPLVKRGQLAGCGWEFCQRGLSSQNGYGFSMIPGYGIRDGHLSSLAPSGSPCLQAFHNT